MSDTPQLLALMQKTKKMKAYDCVKEFESLARKLEKENIALRRALADALGTFQHEDEVIVTAERVEAWKAALINGGQL